MRRNSMAALGRGRGSLGKDDEDDDAPTGGVHVHE